MFKKWGKKIAMCKKLSKTWEISDIQLKKRIKSEKYNKLNLKWRLNSRLNKSVEIINELKETLRNYLVCSREKRRCTAWMRGKRYVG